MAEILSGLSEEEFFPLVTLGKISDHFRDMKYLKVWRFFSGKREEVPFKTSHLRLPQKDVKSVCLGYAIHACNSTIPGAPTKVLFGIHGPLFVGLVSPTTKKLAAVVSFSEAMAKRIEDSKRWKTLSSTFK
ncbi:hypothetical protein K9L27_01250 [Candidatus Gracilibacteria bacterium]|nr:hypothetical protein [Candidatus Gracilibacteria bacterium]